jgi:uncharacterized membrane protein
MNRWFIVGIVLTVLAFGASGFIWAYADELLPEMVPVHWGIDGQPDRFVERDSMFWYLMLPPLLMLGALGMWKVLPWLSPKNFEPQANPTVYEFVMFLVVLLFGFMHVAILYGYIGPPDVLVRLLLTGMCAFFILMGNVLGQVPRNFYVGVRTPWTIASNVVWIKTHRMAAWCFVVAGLVGLFPVVLNLPPAVLFGVFLGTILPAALAPIFYSLWLYKKLEREGKLDLAT